ncbi:MAG TPA: TatD family hydrolase [Atribacteraceae bacterium]|nr:TatD family hydrolase [Atribacteraceae bacterium]
MSFWIDAHTHLDGSEFEWDRREVIARAEAAGVGWVINAAHNLESCRRTLGLIVEYEIIWGALGWHPSEISGQLPDFSELDQLLRAPGVVAVGETGLDAYWDTTYLENQQRAFREHIRLAEQHGLPLVIHSRNTHDIVLDLLEQQARNIPVVWHCFSGDERHLRKALARGYYFSIGGTVTFPRAHTLRTLVQHIPLDRLLLETDAPYLAPQAYRGKRNEPSYLVHTARDLADLFSLTLDELRERIYVNTLCCFPGLRAKRRPGEERKPEDGNMEMVWEKKPVG